jgi:hypothetical protein
LTWCAVGYTVAGAVNYWKISKNVTPSSTELFVTGDSFAFDRAFDTDWPLLLAHKLRMQLRGQGFKGASWWSQRRCLLAQLQIQAPAVVVMCHTDHNRLPSDLDLGLTPGLLAQDDLYVPDHSRPYYSTHMHEAAVLFYQHLYSRSYQLWAAQAWYQQLDQLLAHVEKVIHIWCFEPVYCFSRGMTAEGTLFDLSSHRDHDSKHYSRNHFSDADNIAIAECLQHAINNYADNTSFSLFPVR